MNWRLRWLCCGVWLATSAFAQNATVTANLKQLSGGASQPTGASIRVDLQNCTAPRVPGTGNIGEKTRTFYPNGSGIVTVTLYSNSVIDCGQGVLANPVNFYTFNLVSNGGVTSLGSYKVPAGSSTLDTLTPINTTPIINTPTGDSTYLRLDLGNWSDLIQPVPSVSSSGRVNSNTGYQLNSAAPSNHVLCGNGTNYVDATTCGVNTGVTSFKTRTGAVTPAANDYGFSLLSGKLGNTQTDSTLIYPGTFNKAQIWDHTPTNSGCTTSAGQALASASSDTAGNLTCTHIAVPTQIVQAVVFAACAAAAGTYNTCTVNGTWPNAFPGAYAITCSAIDANAGPGASTNESGIIYPYALTSSGFSVWVQNNRGSFTFTPSSIQCIGVST